MLALVMTVVIHTSLAAGQQVGPNLAVPPSVDAVVDLLEARALSIVPGSNRAGGGIIAGADDVSTTASRSSVTTIVGDDDGRDETSSNYSTRIDSMGETTSAVVETDEPHDTAAASAASRILEEFLPRLENIVEEYNQKIQTAVHDAETAVAGGVTVTVEALQGIVDVTVHSSTNNEGASLATVADAASSAVDDDELVVEWNRAHYADGTMTHVRPAR